MKGKRCKNAEKQFKQVKNRTIATGVPEIFVGGLPSHVTGYDLFMFFERLGTVADVRMMNYRDGKSRGFGFVRYLDMETTRKVLLGGPLYFAGKSVECKLALSKYQSKLFIEHSILKKIYVGNLSGTTTEQDLRDYFEHFGPVKNARIITTYKSEVPRGFGFVAFERGESAEAVLSYEVGHFIHGNYVECKQAISKADTENYLYANLEMEQHESILSSLYNYEEDNWKSMPQDATEESNLAFRCRRKLGHPNSRRHFFKLQVSNMDKSKENSNHSPNHLYKSKVYRTTCGSTITGSIMPTQLSALKGQLKTTNAYQA